MGASESRVLHQIYEDSGDPNESPVYVNKHVFEENGGTLISTFRCMPDAKTTADMIKTAAVKYGPKNFTGEREKLPDGKYGKYDYISYTEFYRRVVAFSRGLSKIGLNPGDKVGIYGPNCQYWEITQFAAHSNSMIVVPVYDSLGPNAAQYIINHAECKAVVCHPSKVQSLLSIAKDCPVLEHIIAMDNQAPSTENSRIMTYTADQIVTTGETETTELQMPKPETIAFIMYTSGSTGTPKGCVLTHNNLISGAVGFTNLGISITTSDTFLSFLPLAHIYELTVEYVMMAQGTAIGFSTGDIRRLTEDIQALKPTIIIGVPRVWNRMVDKMSQKVKALPAPKRMLVEWAIKMKSEAIKAQRPHSFILDRIIFQQFADALGGRVRFLVSGGAPILPEVYDFLRVAICPNIVQGYGLTEVAAGLTVQEIPAFTSCDCGAITPVSMVKLRKVEGFMYNPRGTPACGELLVKGPHVFQGYYKEPKLTDEAFADEKHEWFATGDIVQIAESGIISIIDRAKMLVKLSQGEYLAITNLNDAYGSAPGVANIYVYADSHHDSPAAVVVPTHELIQKWQAAGITNIADSDIAKKEVLQILADEHKKAGMRGFERISAVVLDTEEFSVENGMLTPTLKPQWQSLRKKYECALLEALDKVPKRE
ncbi:AMP-binding enzyme family protein [Trichomonas vaginalis G3]|uniref:AMP-binding enzyme family protein n=1 Tax=Trichomonas vaginalis (strain ATCC PRA-98 / G3) TaxID=412133 RepID=A2FYY9_TRIV3|nr:long chain fatty acid--CoA ligase family [Trichomonas vaginalis G3]EAX89871.1 AMP-binding enzyme family protein [Trichomonas vaginalis G3]KAI5515310.1 long chain fatty acid--CoA ligase family [Trichomonas vaginalis G3]|eukprot:XP_001302801.1 AMP-binding enzyme family protein [Trichomonas vaginalis G3]